MGKSYYKPKKTEPVQSIVRFKKTSQIEENYLIIYNVGPGGVVEIIRGQQIPCDSIFIRIVESYQEMTTEISNYQILTAYYKQKAVKSKVLTK